MIENGRRSSGAQHPDYSPGLRKAVAESFELFRPGGEDARVEHTKPRSPFTVISDASGYLRTAAYEQEYQRLTREGSVRPLERIRMSREHAERVVGSLVDTKSQWIYTVEDKPEDLMALPLEDLRHRMRAIVEPVYTAVSPSLEAWTNAFNKHDLPHAEEVTDIALRLLKKARLEQQQYTVEEIEEFAKVTVISGLSHDLGNLVGRGDHAIASATILGTIIPGFRGREGNHEIWKKVRQPIAYHDSDLLKVVAAEQPDSSIELIHGAREKLSPAALAIMVADKMHIGPDRLSESVLHMSVYDFDKDPHIRVNNEGKSEGFTVSKDGRELTWTIAFNPEFQIRQHRTPSDFDNWKNLVLGIYPDRIRAFAYGGFALIRALESIVIRLEKRVGGEEDESFETIFRPGRIEEKMEEIQRRLPAHLRKKQGLPPFGGK